MQRRAGPIGVGGGSRLWRGLRYAGGVALLALACGCVYWFPAGSRDTSVTAEQAGFIFCTVACLVAATLLLIFEPD